LETLEIASTAYGPDHDFLAAVMHHLGKLYYLTGRPDDAEALFHHSIFILRQKFGDFHNKVADSQMRLAMVLNQSGRFEEAEARSRDAACIYRDLLEGNFWKIAQAEDVLGVALLGQERFAEAEVFLLDSYASYIKVNRPAQSCAQVREHIIDLYQRWGKPDQERAYRLKRP